MNRPGPPPAAGRADMKAIVIVKKNCGVWLHNDTVLRLQVDDSPEPITELKRLVDKWNERRPRAVSPECK